MYHKGSGKPTYGHGDLSKVDNCRGTECHNEPGGEFGGSEERAEERERCPGARQSGTARVICGAPYVEGMTTAVGGAVRSSSLWCRC